MEKKLRQQDCRRALYHAVEKDWLYQLLRVALITCICLSALAMVISITLFVMALFFAVTGLGVSLLISTSAMGLLGGISLLVLYGMNRCLIDSAAKLLHTQTIETFCHAIQLQTHWLKVTGQSQEFQRSSNNDEQPANGLPRNE